MANHIKSQLGPMGTPNGRYTSETGHSVSEASLRPSRLVWAYSWLFLDSQLRTINSPNRRYDPPLATYPPHYPPHLFHLSTPYTATCDITVAVKKLLKIQQC